LSRFSTATIFDSIGFDSLDNVLKNGLFTLDSTTIVSIHAVIATIFDSTRLDSLGSVEENNGIEDEDGFGGTSQDNVEAGGD
jgi:hypothetical protein